MALRKTNATIMAYKLEPTFKAAVTFVDADVIPYNTASWKPETATLEREYTNPSTLLAGAAQQGTSTASGSVAMEVIAASPSTALEGGVLYEVAFGEYNAAGATIDLANRTIVDNIVGSTGTAGVYYLSDGASTQKSLGAKYVIGGVEADSVDIRGVLVSSLKLTFPTQGIVTTDISLEGSTGFIPLDQGADLAVSCPTTSPFVARGMTVTIDSTDICATDLELTITNETADYSCVTETGVGSKSVTKRTISGSFKLAFENLDQINAYNSWESASLFTYAETAAGELLAIKIPVMQRTSLDLADDNGIYVQTVEFSVVSDCAASAQSILIAVQ